MAIQVGGTTVIDNSRNLSNIASADATTVSNLQSAGLGASTTYGGVGTYVFACHTSTNANYFVSGSTYAGSSLYPSGISPRFGFYNTVSGNYMSGSNNTFYVTKVSPTALSGTWRAMGETTQYQYAVRPQTLFVRVS